MPMPTGGRVEDAEHGREVWLAVGALSGASGAAANGAAMAHAFEDGASIASIQLNIVPAADGSFYEAWLENEGDGVALSAGHLTNIFGDVRHVGRLETHENLQERMHVVITRESDDGNPARNGNIVAQGTLKIVKRP